MKLFVMSTAAHRRKNRGSPSIGLHKKGHAATSSVVFPHESWSCAGDEPSTFTFVKSRSCSLFVESRSARTGGKSSPGAFVGSRAAIELTAAGSAILVGTATFVASAAAIGLTAGGIDTPGSCAVINVSRDGSALVGTGAGTLLTREVGSTFAGSWPSSEPTRARILVGTAPASDVISLSRLFVHEGRALFPHGGKHFSQVNNPTSERSPLIVLFVRS